MKNIFIVLLICIIILSCCSGCEVSDPANVEKEVVEAIIVDSGHGRGGSWIQVAYDGVITT